MLIRLIIETATCTCKSLIHSMISVLMIDLLLKREFHGVSIVYIGCSEQM